MRKYIVTRNNPEGNRVNGSMELTEFGVGNRKTNIPFELTKASNFDHETPVPIEDAQIERLDNFVRPVSGVSGGGPYLFEIAAQEDTYLVMSTIALEVTAQITRTDDTDLQATDTVGPINSLGTTMWEQIEVSLNDKLLNPASSANAHYKSYIETILSYDKTAGETHLRSQLFAMDKEDLFETYTNENTGFVERATLVKESRTFDMYSPIMADFLRSNNNLAPGHKLSIKLTRASDNFCLLAPDGVPSTYKIVILDMRLFYDRIRLREIIAPPRVERYLTTGTVLKKFPIAQAMQTANLQIFTGGVKPKTIVVAMVRTTACEGTLRRNPFYFQHFNVSSLMLRIDGKMLPSEPYKPRFDTTPKRVMREYSSLFRNTGSLKMDRGNLLSLVKWCGGQTLFAWDLTPDMCNGFHLHNSGTGTIELALEWRQGLTNPITVLVYMTFDECYTRAAGETDFEREVI